MSDPIFPLPPVAERTNQIDIEVNDSWRRLEAIGRGAIDFEDSPTSSNEGDVFVVGGTPSGAFSSFDPDDIAIFRGGLWNAWAPVAHVPLNIAGSLYEFSESAGWTVISGGGGGAVTSVNGDTGAVIVQVPIGVAASDETTALTTGTAKVTFRMPHAMTLTAVRASLSTAQATNGAGGIFTVDINESGTTILSTKLTIDNTEKTSTTAVTPPVISDANLADDAEMTIDIDQIGDGTAKGLKVWLIGYPS